MRWLVELPVETLSILDSRTQPFQSVEQWYDHCLCSGCMKRLVVILSVVLMVATSSLAEAQPALSTPVQQDPAQYLETDLMIGGAAPVAGLNALVAVQGGYRLWHGLWLHGEAGYGHAQDDQGGGNNMELHAGLESRPCIARGIVCAVVGADLGYAHGAWVSDRAQDQMESVTALVAVPHLGLDLGGDHVRVRLGIEADVTLAGHHREIGGMEGAAGSLVALGLGLGVAYQW
jgi:hypothetical protein